MRGKLYAVLCVCGKQRHSERSPLSGAAVAVQDPTYTFLHLCQAVCKASCDMQFHLFLKFIFKCVYFCVEEGVESKYVRRARALQAPCSRVHVWLCYQVPVVCCSGGGNSPYLTHSCVTRDGWNYHLPAGFEVILGSRKQKEIFHSIVLYPGVLSSPAWTSCISLVPLQHLLDKHPWVGGRLTKPRHMPVIW